MRRRICAGSVLLATVALAAPAAAHDVDIDVLSSRADQVSGGDALVRVEGHRHHLRVLLNGADVTDAFEREGRDLVGLVDGLRLGRNRITVYDRWRRVAKQHLENHPIEGPIFSGPHQRPFVCKTNQPQVGLGEPLVDNQDGDGFRVLAPDGSHRRLEPQLQREHEGRLALPPYVGPQRPGAAAARPAARRTWRPRPRSTARPCRSSSAASAARSTASSTRSPCSPTRRPRRPTPRAGTGGSSTSSTAAWRSAATRARSAARR